jgi:4a-hydroxytetrahydrobiopterin dehydratase
MNTHLAEKDCANLKENNSRLSGKDIVELKKALHNDWQVVDGRRLKRTFKFPDFAQGLDFTNLVGNIAEEQNHHPDVHLAYGQVGVEFSTHSAGGLTESDFILAAKVDELK